MRKVHFWLPSVAQTRLCLSSLIAVVISCVIFFCLFFFVFCLSFVVVTRKTSCRTSTSSHHSNYSTKAPPVKSFPACGFCTSQGNLKSQCHLLNTLKCYMLGGATRHMLPHFHGTPPPCKQAPSVWSRWLSICQVVVVVDVVLFFFFFIVWVDKNTKKNDAAILIEQTWSIKDVLCDQKQNYFLKGPTREMSSPLSRLAN